MGIECGCSRASRYAILVGLSRRLALIAHEPPCREVGGYMRGGPWWHLQKKDEVWLLTRESPRNLGWTFSPPVSRRARVVVPRGRWVYKRGSSETPSSLAAHV